LPLDPPNGWIIDHLVDAIMGRPSQISGFEDGYETLKIIDMIRNPAMIEI
jgi:hypothetical protein